MLKDDLCAEALDYLIAPVPANTSISSEVNIINTPDVLNKVQMELYSENATLQLHSQLFFWIEKHAFLLAWFHVPLKACKTFSHLFFRRICFFMCFLLFLPVYVLPFCVSFFSLFPSA